jgi:dephospho-CoA kinase
MQKPITIGITGGIGSGKSTVAKVLCEKGFAVYDSDFRAKKLQDENPEVRRKITELFGNKTSTGNSINRAWIAKIVFADKNKLAQLNEVIHPAVKTDFLRWKKEHAKEKILFLESAILFESEFNSLVDKVLLITANKETRIERTISRNNVSREKVLQRIENQIDEAELIKKSDFVITNDENISINEKVEDFLELIHSAQIE